jgi:hypothetical protein
LPEAKNRRPNLRPRAADPLAVSADMADGLDHLGDDMRRRDIIWRRELEGGCSGNGRCLARKMVGNAIGRKAQGDALSDAISSRRKFGRLAGARTSSRVARGSEPTTSGASAANQWPESRRADGRGRIDASPHKVTTARICWSDVEAERRTRPGYETSVRGKEKSERRDGEVERGWCVSGARRDSPAVSKLSRPPQSGVSPGRKEAIKPVAGKERWRDSCLGWACWQYCKFGGEGRATCGNF